MALALASAGYPATVVEVRERGGAVAVWPLGNPKLHADRACRAAVIAKLCGWGLAVDDERWGLAVTGTFSPSPVEVAGAADAAMLRALVAERGDARAARAAGRVSHDGEVFVVTTTEGREAAVQLAARFVGWAEKAAGLTLTAGEPRFERGGRYDVRVWEAGATRTVRCPACDSESQVTGRGCPACDGRGVVKVAAEKAA